MSISALASSYTYSLQRGSLGVPPQSQLLLESSIMKQDNIVVLKKFPVLLLVSSQESYTSTLDLKWVDVKKANGRFSTPCDAIATMYSIDMSRKTRWQQAQLCKLVLNYSAECTAHPIGS